MKRKGSRLLLLVLFCLSVLAGAGCGNKAGTVIPSKDTSASGELQKIIITEPARGELWAPIYVAQTLGYFKEAGLDVEFQTVSGADSGAPVIAGQAQFGFMGIEMPIGVTEAGQGVKVLLSTTQRFPYCFMSKKAFSTIPSLKGQTVAGGAARSGSPTAWVRACLKYGGLDPDKDVNLVAMKPGSLNAAMAAGDIQACNGSGIAIHTLVEQGAQILVDGRDPVVFKSITGSENYEMYIMFATDKYIAENPETVQKVVTACTRGLKWVNEHETEAIVDALLPLFPDKKADLLISIKDAKDYKIFSQNGRHSEAGFNAALKMAKESGMISGNVAAEKIYDESFLNKAWATLGK
ncbi:MAG: ABC transporter substrate-binding protein [Syntrophomonas sp.]